MNGDPLPENPVKWLLKELAQYLDGEALDQLQSDYEIVKRRYDLTSRLRATQTELQRHERTIARGFYEPEDQSYKRIAVRIEARKARIAQLTKELDELASP